jgi:hypothetical protein
MQAVRDLIEIYPSQTQVRVSELLCMRIYYLDGEAVLVVLHKRWPARTNVVDENLAIAEPDGHI